MTPKKNVIIAVLIVALILGAFYLFRAVSDRGILTLYGNVDIRQVNLGFRVQGRLQTLHFEEGDLVKVGDVLAELDPMPYVEEVKQAQERVNSIIASYKNANILFQRRDKLVASNSVSQEDYDQALYNRDTLLGNLKEAEAALAAALIDLEDTTIVNLNQGIILSRVREPGTICKVSDPVYVVSISDPVWVRVYVTEPNLGKIYPGMEGEVYTDTLTNPVYKGKIGFISPVAEFTPKNVETTDLRTDLVYRLRIYIDHPDQGLRQGMPVTVKLRVK